MAKKARLILKNRRKKNCASLKRIRKAGAKSLVTSGSLFFHMA
jgi:hypothetical protein